MAVWTDTDLRNKTLEHIGVKPVGVSASARDVVKFDDVWASQHHLLLREGLAPFSKDAIPEAVQDSLVRYLAPFVAAKFGYTGPRFQEYVAGMDLGKRELQREYANDSNQPTEADYF